MRYVAPAWRYNSSERGFETKIRRVERCFEDRTQYSTAGSIGRRKSKQIEAKRGKNKKGEGSLKRGGARATFPRLSCFCLFLPLSASTFDAQSSPLCCTAFDLRNISLPFL